MARRKKSKITFGKNVISSCKKIKKAILSFYKASEFNRGLSVGMVILIMFTVGYTAANAALPTANDYPDYGTPDYEVLFPDNYIKPQFNTYLHYYIDTTNANTNEIAYAANDGMTMYENAYNDILLYDGDADPTLNFTFFTNKINNDSSTALAACETEYNDNDRDYCGAYLKMNHTFYKHVITYPTQRGKDGSNNDIANHMYFYNDSLANAEELTMTVVTKPRHKFMRDTMDPAPIAFFDMFNLKKLFDIDKSLATNIPEPPMVKPPVTQIENTRIETIGEPQAKSYILKGTVQAFITAGFLDTSIFKPISYLTRSDKPSYVFDGLTAEPNTPYSTYTPEDYADGIAFAAEFNTGGSLTPFYFLQGSKLKLIDNWSCSGSPCDTWENEVNDPEIRIVSRHVGPIKAKITFYNTSVNNFVTFEKDFLDYVMFDSDDAGGDYDHLFVYHGTRSLLSTASLKDSVTLYIGKPAKPINTAQQEAADISYFYDEDDILNIFIPKAKADSTQNQPIAQIQTVLKEYKGEVKSDIASLIREGILPPDMFEPSENFKNSTKSYMYWENDIYPATEDLSPITTTTAQQELIDASKWNIKATPLDNLLTYRWINNAMPQEIIVPGYKDSGNVQTSPHNILLTHPITNFKFSPTIEVSNIDHDNMFISEYDFDVYMNTVAPTGDPVGINMCYVVLTAPSTCIGSGVGAMNEYEITLPSIDTGTTQWELFEGIPGLEDHLGLYYEIYDADSPYPVKDSYVVPVKINGELPEPPIAYIDATPRSTSSSDTLTVTFDGSTTRVVDSWLWDFGDGYTSTLEDPIHTYTSTGTYTVILEATNMAGNFINTEEDYIVVSNNAY